MCFLFPIILLNWMIVIIRLYYGSVFGCLKQNSEPSFTLHFNNLFPRKKQKPSLKHQFVVHLFFGCKLNQRYFDIFLPIYQYSFRSLWSYFILHINKINLNDITLFSTQHNYVPPSSFRFYWYYYRMQKKREKKSVKIILIILQQPL